MHSFRSENPAPYNVATPPYSDVATQLLMWDGAPGDVVEFSRALTGKLLGSIKIKAGGKLDSWFVWEN